MLTLYAHPFSSYCQKVLIALWENGSPFTYRHLEEPGAAAEHAARWPLGRFPVLIDGERVIAESSIIIEYLDIHHAGTARMVPADAAAALEVRFMDRLFDNHVMTPVQRAVGAALKQDTAAAQAARAEAAEALTAAYRWLDTRLADRRWGAGDCFTLADCAAAPSLFYADWVHEIASEFTRVRDYRTRLLAHPSVARAVAEGRPYRHYFPLGAPDRD